VAGPTWDRPAPAPTEARRVLEVLRRRKWLVLAAVVGLAVAAGAVSGLRTPVYEATARVLLRPSDPAERLDGTAALRAPTDPNRYVRAQAQIAASEAVARKAAELVEGVTTEEIRDRLSIGHGSESDVLVIAARDLDPALARDIANAVARGYLENRRLSAVAGLDHALAGIEAQLGPLLATIADLDAKIARTEAAPGATAEVQLPGALPAPAPPPAASGSGLTRGGHPATSEGLKAARYAAAVQYEELYGRLQQLRIERDLKKGEAELIAEAEDPEAPVSPRPQRDAAMGAVVGLLLAGGYVFLRELVDDRVHSVAEIEAVTGLPTLAELPYDEESADRTSVAAVERPRSALSEAARSLRTSVHYLGVDQPVRTIVVTSAVPGEGKSLVSANLAVVCAQAGLRTILVSADLRRGALPHLLADGGSSPGLTGVVTDGTGGDPGAGSNGAGPERSAAAAVVRTTVPKLAFLPPGPVPPNPAELLGSRRTAELLDELRGAADVVVIDTPPLLAVTDAAVLAARADGVMVVTALGETRRDSLERAVRILRHTGVRILGTVVNKTRTVAPYPYYGPDGGAGPTERAPARRLARRR
jgi:capsular exopolysaccharide synthesis family protein